MRRTLTTVLLIVLALGLAACSNKRVQNPMGDLDSKQPDKVLFDNAMEALKKNKFDVARLSLQTLINTYPDSEYIARAKLGVADAWYFEGGSAALAQAENEYKDFITFFPNMNESAEAQMRVGDIHFRQMEKPDRDFTHAKRAEEEYKTMILQYPDFPRLAEAKQKLMQVQEVLAEREFRIGRFYFLRQSWAASVARLKSVVDSYPLYSGADEALYMIGRAYQGQAETIRAAQMHETLKAKMLAEITKNAVEAYKRLITRYPVMARVEDAKERLRELNQPIPEPSDAAIAQNRAEQESRGEAPSWWNVWAKMRKAPDMTQTARVGEPTLTEVKETDATQIVRGLAESMATAAAEEASRSQVSAETVKGDAPPPNEAAPRSGSDTPGPQPTEDAAPPPAPQQVNQAEGADSSSKSADKKSDKKDDKEVSSSKKKKKKGLGRLNPF
jgi:outer membrane protein assembly factor BamD